MTADTLMLAPGALAAVLAAVPAAAADFDLASAIASARPGAVITVPEGTYPGPFVIEQPMTVAAAGTVVLDG
ncbi:MAG: nitrous oxide reductase family maturation protein NosD, partial [Planctomycetota bacterium]